jgi:hypothetical protein
LPPYYWSTLWKCSEFDYSALRGEKAPGRYLASEAASVGNQKIDGALLISFEKVTNSLFCFRFPLTIGNLARYHCVSKNPSYLDFSSIKLD